MTRILVLAIAGVFAVHSSVAQDFAKERELAIWVDGAIRSRINAIGSPALNKLIPSIDFEVNTELQLPNAYAGWKDGRRVIGITTDLIMVTFYISEISALMQTEGFESWGACDSQYTSYLREWYIEAATDGFNGVAIKPFIPVEYFGESCRTIAGKYPFSGQSKILRDQYALSALGMIYLHELGHHYYDDFTTAPVQDAGSVREFLESACVGRDKERRADQFAVRTFIDLGWQDSAIDITAWKVMSATGSIDPSLEQISDHPSPLVRMALALNEARSYSAAQGNPMTPAMAAMVDETLQFQKKVEDTLPPFQYPEAEGFECR